MATAPGVMDVKEVKPRFEEKLVRKVNIKGIVSNLKPWSWFRFPLVVIYFHFIFVLTFQALRENPDPAQGFGRTGDDDDNRQHFQAAIKKLCRLIDKLCFSAHIQSELAFW